MAQVQVTPTLFDPALFSAEHQTKYKEKFRDYLKKLESLDEKCLKEFIKDNAPFYYPKEITKDKITHKGIIVLPDPPAEEQVKKTDAEKLAEEAEKLKKLELEQKVKQDADVVDEDSEKAKKDREAAVAAAEAAAERRAKIEKALTDATLDDNPFGFNKLKDMKDDKCKFLVGYNCINVKYKLFQKLEPDKGIKTFRQQKAGEIDVDKIDWDSAMGERLLAMSFCVIMNGPVGKSKATNWPNIAGTHSIQDTFILAGYEETVTNSMWKKFCTHVMDFVDLSIMENRDCPNMRRYGKLWPACDNEMVTHAETRRSCQEETLRTRGDKIVKDMQR